LIEPTAYGLGSTIAAAPALPVRTAQTALTGFSLSSIVAFRAKQGEAPAASTVDAFGHDFIVCTIRIGGPASGAVRR
jgi:hypothetical protein